MKGLEKRGGVREEVGVKVDERVEDEDDDEGDEEEEEEEVVIDDDDDNDTGWTATEAYRL